MRSLVEPHGFTAVPSCEGGCKYKVLSYLPSNTCIVFPLPNRTEWGQVSHYYMRRHPLRLAAFAFLPERDIDSAASVFCTARLTVM